MIDFRSSLRRTLLTYYAARPRAQVYVRELAAQLDVDPTNVSRELSRLEQEGLFQSETRGNHKYYSLDRNYPLFREVLSLLQKRLGVAPAVLDALKKFPEIETAYLYGSFAKLPLGSETKVGVLIIGTPPASRVASTMNRLETLLYREFRYTVLTGKELEEKLSAHDPFVTSVWNRKCTQLNLHRMKSTPPEKSNATQKPAC